MARYAVFFQFRDDATADDRRRTLLREIARCARHWGGIGGMALVETDEPLATLEARLYLDSTLNAMKDGLMVVELAGDAAARGALADRDGLRALLPDVAVA